MKIYDGSKFAATFAGANKPTIFDLTPVGSSAIKDFSRACTSTKRGQNGLRETGRDLDLADTSYHDHQLSSDFRADQVRRDSGARRERERQASVTERSSRMAYELTAPGIQRLARKGREERLSDSERTELCECVIFHIDKILTERAIPRALRARENS